MRINPLRLFHDVKATKKAKKETRKINKARKREERRIREEALHRQYVDNLYNSITPFEELETYELVKINAHKDKGIPWVEVIVNGNKTTRIYHYEGQKATCDDADLQALADLEEELREQNLEMASCEEELLDTDDDSDDEDDTTADYTDPNEEYWAMRDAEEEAEREALYDEIGSALSGFIAGIS